MNTPKHTRIVISRPKPFYKCTCVFCGKPFEHNQKRRKTCSAKCMRDLLQRRARERALASASQEKGMPFTLTCEGCGKTFDCPTPRRTCSAECKALSLRLRRSAALQKQKAEPKPFAQQRPLYVRPCEICGKPFENRIRRRKITCSKECKNELTRRTMENYWNQQAGKTSQVGILPPVETHCMVCDSIIINKGRDIRKTCSKACLEKYYVMKKAKKLSHDRVCVACGKMFTVHIQKTANTYVRTTCSLECLKQYQRNLSQMKRRSPLSRPCVICGKTILLGTNRTKKTCSRECLSEHFRRMRTGKKFLNKARRWLSTAVMHTLTCIICKKVFTLTPKQFKLGRKTCSYECRNKQIAIVNKDFRHSPEVYAIIGEKARTHPKTGHFVTNHHAKDYSLISPWGEPFIFRNLSLFVDVRRDLFVDIYGSVARVKIKTVCGALMLLAPWVRKRKDSWRGWTWYDPPTEDSQPQGTGGDH